MSFSPHFYALIVAAGRGQRFLTTNLSQQKTENEVQKRVGHTTPPTSHINMPKQYWPLAGRPMVWHSMTCFLSMPMIHRVAVVISPDDTQWDTQEALDINGHAFSPQDKTLDKTLMVLRCGGESRAHSVLSGLRACRAQGARVHDWVLVHDAARPCIKMADINHLIHSVLNPEQNNNIGGILAVPVADTLKKAKRSGSSSLPNTSVSSIDYTPPRDDLWQAQTPQMFQFGTLIQALEQGDLSTITDEASAVEQWLHHPANASTVAKKANIALVQGSRDNIKVTYADDLIMAQLILEQAQ